VKSHSRPQFQKNLSITYSGHVMVRHVTTIYSHALLLEIAYLFNENNQES